MRRLTILTERYEKILHKTLHTFLQTCGEQEWIVRSEGRKEKIFYARISYAPGGKLIETLAALLEEIAALENSAYLEFPDLMENARSLRGSPVSRENERRLAEFLADNAVLNIEGYAAFRMADYKFKLDLISYDFMKKLLHKKLRMTER